MNFRRVRTFGAVVGIGALLMLVMACALEGEAATLKPGSGDGIATDPQPPAHYGGFGSSGGRSIDESPAIWVTGEGKVSIEPELAVLDLGVEVTMETVAAARDKAATAMDAVMTALESNGVEEKDIQTRNFDIRPRYEWQEVVENGTRSSRDVLVGYRVSNRLTAKVRDLDEVSTVIDEVISAGGDSIRFRDLTFTVEDVTPLLGELREDAVSDAKAKAHHFADISRVTLGRLIYMAEPGAGQRGGDVFVRSQSFALESAAAAAPPTGVSGGELQVTLNIQVAYAIW
jgi:uncharacterized protein YggE